MADTTPEDFWQGYACAMETIEYRLKSGFSVEDTIEFARTETEAADKKIADIRRIEGR